MGFLKIRAAFWIYLMDNPRNKMTNANRIPIDSTNIGLTGIRVAPDE